MDALEAVRLVDDDAAPGHLRQVVHDLVVGRDEHLEAEERRLVLIPDAEVPLKGPDDAQVCALAVVHADGHVRPA